MALRTPNTIAAPTRHTLRGTNALEAGPASWACLRNLPRPARPHRSPRRPRKTPERKSKTGPSSTRATTPSLRKTKLNTDHGDSNSRTRQTCRLRHPLLLLLLHLLLLLLKAVLDKLLLLPLTVAESRWVGPGEREALRAGFCSVSAEVARQGVAGVPPRLSLWLLVKIGQRLSRRRPHRHRHHRH